MQVKTSLEGLSPENNSNILSVLFSIFILMIKNVFLCNHNRKEMREAKGHKLN